MIKCIYCKKDFRGLEHKENTCPICLAKDFSPGIDIKNILISYMGNVDTIDSCLTEILEVIHEN